LFRPHNLLKLRHDLLGREAVGRNFDRVCRFYECADRARPIAMIAEPLIRENLIEGDLFTASQQIGVTATGTLFFIRREKNLALGIRKNDGSLVPPLGDDIAICRRGPLPTHKLRPHCRVVGSVMNGVRNLKSPHRGRNVSTIQYYAVINEFYTNHACQSRKLFAIRQVDVALSRRQRDCPIHRARIEKPETQPPR
jgi:hypothetical protein